MPTRICCGAHCVVAVGAAAPASHSRHLYSASAAITVVTAPAGLSSTEKAFEFAPVAQGGCWLGYDLSGLSASSKTGVLRVKVYFVTLPNVDCEIIGFGGSGYYSIAYQASTQSLRVLSSNGTPGASPLVVTTGQWYVLDLKEYIGSGNTGQGRVTDEAGVVNELGAPAGFGGDQGFIDSFQVGLGFFNTVVTGTIRMSAITLSMDLGDYPIGDGKVLAVRPGRDGVHVVGAAGNFKINNATNIDGTETTLYQNIDDDPIDSTADRLTQNVVAAGDYLEFRPPADIGIPDSPRCVTVLSPMRNESLTTVNDISLKMLSGANSDDVVHASLAKTSHIYLSKGYAQAPGAVPWTKALIEGLLFRYGFSTDVDPIPALHSLLLEVEYPPLPAFFPQGRFNPFL